MALAFEEYLNAKALAWVLDDLGDGPLPEQKRCRLDDVPLPERSEEDGADWEAVLYFLIHLVPVDAIGRLQHQIRKWSFLEKKPCPTLRRFSGYSGSIATCTTPSLRAAQA